MAAIRAGGLGIGAPIFSTPPPDRSQRPGKRYSRFQLVIARTWQVLPVPEFVSWCSLVSAPAKTFSRNQDPFLAVIWLGVKVDRTNRPRRFAQQSAKTLPSRGALQIEVLSTEDLHPY